jgi:hypothetical protein
MVGAEPDARGSPNDADVLSRFWFSSRSHSGSLSFHLRVGLLRNLQLERPSAAGELDEQARVALIPHGR